MTIRQEMLKSAKRSANLLGESASLVVSFLTGRLTTAGGFCGRDDTPDLYYTLFAIESLIALDAPLPIETITPWITAFGDGDDLDLVHLACLARCRAALNQTDRIHALLDRIDAHRSYDGGYAEKPSQAVGTAYGGFLALGAYQDIGAGMDDRDALAESLLNLQRTDGGFGNSADIPVASAPATAAALTTLRHLDRPISEAAVAWLVEQIGPDGGIGAWNGAPAPDLLSTAVSLHALYYCGVKFDDLRQRCLDFCDSLWTSRGGFRGHGGDQTLDCEYTFYGLLALGSLA
jgi:prenyltransferase beta subunit